MVGVLSRSIDLGADLKLAKTQSVSLKKIKEIIRDLMKDSSVNGVDTYAAKMDDEQIHVYFTDGNALGDFILASNNFQNSYSKGNFFL